MKFTEFYTIDEKEIKDPKLFAQIAGWKNALKKGLISKGTYDGLYNDVVNLVINDKERGEVDEAIIDNENFKKWFGNSKVVDKNGNPLVVYHGTENAGFKKFLMSKSHSDTEQGFWFTDNPKNADGYHSIGSGGMTGPGSGGMTGPGSGTYAVYLSLKRPLEVDWKEYATRKGSPFGDAYNKFHMAQLFIDAKRGGYDGIIIRKIRDSGYSGRGDSVSDSYVAFEPNQIKSATGNNGDYNPNSDNINEAVFVPKFFEILEDGKAMRIFNVNIIPDSILSKINTYMKRKGYDVRGVDDVRRILLKYENNSYGGVISVNSSKDWIDAILASMPKEKSPQEKIDSRVKRYFGLTDDFEVAGYITPDGKMLDFSGRRQGNTFGKGRYMDHRQVGYAFTNTDLEGQYSGQEGMEDFMDLGYVRINFPNSIHIRKALTPEQRKTLERFIRNSYAEDITLSLQGKSEPVYQNFEVKEFKYNPSKLIQFIDRYFSGGYNSASLVQKFHSESKVTKGI